MDAARRRLDDEDRGKVLSILDRLEDGQGRQSQELSDLRDRVIRIEENAKHAAVALAEVRGVLEQFRQIAVEYPWTRRILAGLIALILLGFWSALKDRVWPPMSSPIPTTTQQVP